MIWNPYVGQWVELRYDRHHPMPGWHRAQGEIVTVGRGPGPRNVAVRTSLGVVVVPRGNCIAAAQAASGAVALAAEPSAAR